MRFVKGVQRLTRSKTGTRQSPGRFLRTVFLWSICIQAGVWAAVVDPVGALDGVGPPFQIGKEHGYCPAQGRQELPAVAFDGTNYMVVWQDNRRGSWEIRGARVDRSGTVLDPAGIVISTGIGSEKDPAIAFDGTNYMVVWQDNRSGSWDIYGVRVDRSGTVLDPDSIAIATGTDGRYEPAIASDGMNYMVAWTEEVGDSAYDIHGARVSAGGILLDPEALVLSTAAGSQRNPAVTFDGTDYMVVWEDGRNGTSSYDIYGARLNVGGSLIDPEGIAISTAAGGQWNPAIAFDGTNYMVAWEDGRSGSYSYDIYSARIDLSGTVLDLGGIAVVTTRDDQRHPAISFGGTSYMLIWADGRAGSWDTWAARVSVVGSVLDPGGVPIANSAGDQWDTAVAFGGTNYMVVWAGAPSGFDSSIYGARVDRSGSTLDPTGIAVSTEEAGDQGDIAIAFDGTNYMVVWREACGGFHDIYGARIDRAGNVLDPGGIVISNAPGDQSNPDIASNGTNYMVVWEEERDGRSGIYATRVDRSGKVLDPRRMAISTESGEKWDPAIASDGTNYMVVWTYFGTEYPNSHYDIHGARVDPSGKVLGAPVIVISTRGDYPEFPAGGPQQYPAIVFNGTDYMVVWADARKISYIDAIYGTRVDGSGMVLDPGGIAISPENRICTLPAIATDGTSCMVIYWCLGRGIEGTRVDRSGISLDPDGIAISDLNYYSAIAFDGTNYMVVWSENRGGLDYDIYGARIDRSGAVLDTLGIALCTEQFDQGGARLASGSCGQALMAYSSFTPSPNGGENRIWGDFLDTTPLDETPPEITVGIHQNPELTAELDIYLIASEAVQDTSVWLGINGTPLSVVAVDTLRSVFCASYRLSVPGTVSVCGRARDVCGNAAEKTRSFGAGLISAGQGGHVVAPGGRVSLRCPAHSMDKDSYILILADEPSSGSVEDSVAARFTLSPSAMRLKSSGVLNVKLTQTNLWPQLWREGICGWEEMQSSYDQSTGCLSAYVDSLGGYKVLLGPAGPRVGGIPFLCSIIPNPFSELTHVRYQLPAASEVHLAVYDGAGRLVRTLLEDERSPGRHIESWDGRDAEGDAVSSGVYFIRLVAGSEGISKKCVLVR
jgi:hypothetical protein